MSLDEFHLFLALPPELRRKIYLLATPSRIVHVQEGLESKEDFNGRVDSIDFSQVELHPSLPSFADDLRRGLSFYAQKGVRARIKFYPGGMPHIPAWLLSSIDVLERFLRKGRVYSKAPIPALLHTWVESRDVLISAGYRLAFGTRDHKPWTWFHFQNDVLNLNYETKWTCEPGSTPSIVDYFKLGVIGKIDTESLQGVRKLLLTNIFPILHYNFGGSMWALCVVRLLSKLDKLYLVEWDMNPYPRYGPNGLKLGRQIPDAKRELLHYIPIEPVDVLFDVFQDYPYSTQGLFFEILESEALGGEVLEVQDDPVGQYFQCQIDRQVKWFEECRDTIVRRESADTWQIPTIEVVHLGSESRARRLFKRRQEVWKNYVLPKLACLQQQNSSVDMDSIPVPPTDQRGDLEYHHLIWRVSQCVPRQELIMGP